MPTCGFSDTLAEDDFLGTLLRVNVISKFPKQHPLDKSLLTYALPRPPTKGDGHKEVDLLSWCHSFYCQLHQNNDTVLCMGTLLFPVLQWIPPADKKCLTEKCSCWDIIDETLIGAW
ncbi:hypothetical protein H8959_016638 [Pygathrix nigripes]